MPNQPGIDDHTAHAHALAARYASIDRETLFPASFWNYAQELGRPLEILDIGCGSGDDAFMLAQKGHRVTGIDPSGLLRIAQETHAHPNITYVNDQLPALASQEQRFDFINMSAVWQYIDPAERQDSLRRIASLLNPQGKLCISYPTPPSRPEQFRLDPATFERELAAVNTTLPKSQQLQLVTPPTLTQDAAKRQNASGEDIYFCQYMLESTGLAKSLAPRQDRSRS